jgi:glutamyl-tRNA synthetase
VSQREIEVRPYRGRFAPSPTGELHLGSVATALFAAARARRAGGALVLRVEDLDAPRVVPGSEASQLDDLAWLGIVFDEGPREGGPARPYRQSERTALYAAAIDALARAGHTYLCDCSRAEIARVASAPHEGEEGPRYPGTCRPNGMAARDFRRPPAVRLAVPTGREVRWEDAVTGPAARLATDVVSDFVLRRADGAYAYQLATLVDDVAMRITEVVRGADLAPSAPKQALLAELLGASAPRYLHVPMLTGADGDRLAKRAGGATVRGERARGRAPGELLASIARAYGQDVAPAPAEPRAVLDSIAAALDCARFPTSGVSASSIGASA